MVVIDGGIIPTVVLRGMHKALWYIKNASEYQRLSEQEILSMPEFLDSLTAALKIYLSEAHWGVSLWSDDELFDQGLHWHALFLSDVSNEITPAQAFAVTAL